MKVGRVENYPWYQELISFGWLVSVLVAAALAWSQLPARMAVHFDSAGQPDGYSSKGTALALVVGIVLFNWSIDAAIRYQFLTAERDAKRFNWIQFLIVPGVVVSAGCWHLIADFNINGGPFKLSFMGGIGWVATCLGLLAVTEHLRAKAESEYGESLLGPDLEGPLPEKFCLVDAEAPRWWVLLMGIPGVSMIVGGAVMLFVPNWVMVMSGVMCIFGGFLMLLFAGGFRFVVHHNGVEVAFGTLSIPIKSITVADIEAVELKDFNALADYGGWGLRWGADNTTAYVISGEVGVLLRTAKRNYLLGTSQAPAFLSAIEQLRGR